VVRIIIVKLGSIGDIVHALPALAAIKLALPSAHVTWAVETRSSEILRGNPMVDRLVELDTKSVRANGSVNELLKGLKAQVGELRQNKYDIAIDMQGLIKSAVVAKLSGAKKRFGFAGKALREPASRILLTDAVRVPPKTHIVRKNLILARAALGVDIAQPPAFPITINEQHAAEAARVIAQVGTRFAILNPAGGWPTKLWDAADYGLLADLVWDRLRMPSVIVTGPKEAHLSAAAVAASKSGKAFPAELSLKGFFALAQRANVYVGGDTGPTHLAIAAGTPVVGIFGPTEWWRNGSTDPNDICVERTDIGCRVDCHRRSCSNWICMDIPVERVFDAVSSRLLAAEITAVNV
jgi:lipopolysaccharide heptosyltransferase I